jgi:hypothetical protein
MDSRLRSSGEQKGSGIACLLTSTNALPLPAVRAQFHEVTGCHEALAIPLPSQLLLLASGEQVKSAVSLDGRIRIWLLGELFPPGLQSTDALVRAYWENQSLPARDLNGSFCALVVDTASDEVVAVTDRLSSRQLFVSQRSNECWITTHLDTQPRSECAVDPVGLGWYLSHGVVHAGRTLHKEIRSLGAGSIHRIRHGKTISSVYWSQRFHAASSTPRIKLVRGLQERLVEAVKRRLTDDPDVYLSLSGGYDAAGILGILSERLRAPSVRCFSYARGKPRPGSDEAIAARMASAAGREHSTIEAYNGDFIAWLNENAEHGNGVCNLCDETQAWSSLDQLMGATDRPAIFAGDECLGWVDCRLRDSRQALLSVGIRGSADLAQLSDGVESSLLSEMQEGIDADVRAMVAKQMPISDLHDLKDGLYIAERMPSVIMRWRACFPGRFAPVRNPLLDSELLEFMAQVPSSERRQKRLYRRAIIELAPKVFSVPRARRASYGLDLTTELISHHHAIRQRFLQFPSQLDPLIPPVFISKLLESVNSRAAKPSLRSAAIGKLRSSIRQLGVGDVLRPFVSPRTPNTVPLATLLTRLLVARAVLSSPT